MKQPAEPAKLTPSFVREHDPAVLLMEEREALKKVRQSKRMAEGWLGFGVGLYILLLSMFFVLFFSAPFEALMILLALADTYGSEVGLFIVGITASVFLFTLLVTLSLTQIDRFRQKAEDRLARIAFIELASGASVRFSLYLRAFDTTGQIRSGSGNSFLSRYRAVVSYLASEIWASIRDSKEDRSESYSQLFVSRRNHAEIEAAISHDIRSEMPLVALGMHDNRDGAGKVSTTDEHWKDTVTLLINKAERIFCVPDDNPGTLWEVKQLKFLGALDRTVFIMPSSKMLPDRHASFPTDWAHMAESVRNEGLHFPDYDPAGGFFGTNGEGIVDYRISFSLGSRGTFRYIHEEMQRMRRPTEVLEAESYERRRRRRSR